MGLFDSGDAGGGLDMDALMRMLNPMGTAQAGELNPTNTSIQPGGAGVGPNMAPNTPLTDPNQLINAIATRQSPPLMPPVGPTPVPTIPIQGQTRDISPPDTTPGPVTFPPQAGIPPGARTAPTVDQLPPPVALPRGTSDTGLPPDVGAGLTGKTPGAPTDVSARAKTPEEAKNPTLAEALKGVKAPAPPVLQKISSPAGPRPSTPIKGGDLQALLMALNAGAPNITRPLPVTLGGR